MNATKNAEVNVTLSSELFDRLQAEARSLGVDLTWLVASLVADTIDREPNFRTT